MALGDNRFDVSNRLLSGFDDHVVSVMVTRSVADQDVTRDKFGKPTATVVTATIQIVVSQAREDIKPTAAGGKPVEVLEFYTQPGDISENDEITWNGHTFRTSSVWPFGLGGLTQMLSCQATRELDV
ncbi:hypothetical protein LLE49_19500 [Alicyclobacillus tolerans]|uniref:hypothetical protein n=1 Tax=Alicyclobacillus tolerans TaxID=90970 RepID=UPI001F3F6756|nr:hypothetical protein [Alicyclobacillus tolerans]MCF8566908.1 hypothetical protein [Alicyclobacillus tolerans]